MPTSLVPAGMRRPRAVIALLLFAVTTATPVAAQTDVPFSDNSATPRPFEALSRTLLTGRDRLVVPRPDRDSLVSAARAQLGLRYRLGALAPGRAFDCSGLVKWVLGLFDIEMPRTAAQQARQGVELPRNPDRLLPGDLLYFGRGKRVTHIGIYVGEGRYIHASNPRSGIIESPLPASNSSWWKGARRIIPSPLDDPESLFDGLTPTSSDPYRVIRIM